MTRRSLLHRALALTIGLAAGCGGDDNGGKAVTCSSLSPSDCGGDVSGTWAIQSVCGSAQVPLSDQATLPAECAGTAMTVQPGTSSGTATFTNGSYTLTQNVAFTVAVQFSPACITAIAGTGGDTTSTCSAIGQAASAQGVTLTCSMQGDACDCSGSMSDSQNESGTYTVSGNQLTMTPTSSSSGNTEASTSTFCVRSGYMVVELPPLSTSAAAMHIVLKKQ